MQGITASYVHSYTQINTFLFTVKVNGDTKHNQQFSTRVVFVKRGVNELTRYALFPHYAFIVTHG